MAAERFRMIQDEDSVPVICLYRGPDGADTAIDTLLGTLRRDGPERWLMRKRQRHSVNCHRRDALRLLKDGAIEEIMPGLYAQISDQLYHPTLGLLTEAAVSAMPASACVV
jgi:CRISPR-associated endonuclease/helicase Cas3